MPDEREEPRRAIELQLLDILDKLRDDINLAFELATRDIQRLLKQNELDR